ncbi:MAG: HAD-IIIA family hydrolase [Verrucomicrobia bacterium]|nr:HAD-IIIA family hydrolase [Verrucomicrobiota bacterium]MBU4246956.1 HAD-IIIA family hydrolase [Verrucomicrobiota bacterium]MBU4291336.1 HAD-IIIA family hydrolase [Verrucomicrobiota bacterium]MBU4498087.1 HAD-IIIA family hydrolase [Verrucomicrobiota bacterium]MCG2680038.1 HAD-IIIA family hydrolase [Kiritimatiellia bacterium]
MPQKKCVFFDRDGIVNKSPGAGKYVLGWEEFHLVPEFPECLQIAHCCGYEAAIVTNQRAVALGLLSASRLDAIHQRLRDLLEREYRQSVLDILYCPHDVGACACRKPNPGMLLTIAARHAVDLGRSWMVGDAETDVEAGRRAGCRTILVGPASADARADARVDTIQALPALLESLL